MSSNTTPDLLSQPLPALQDPPPVETTPGEVFPGSRAGLRKFNRDQREAEQELWAASMRTAIKTDPALTTGGGGS